jgi:hypothetical protein
MLLCLLCEEEEEEEEEEDEWLRMKLGYLFVLQYETKNRTKYLFNM